MRRRFIKAFSIDVGRDAVGHGREDPGPCHGCVHEDESDARIRDILKESYDDVIRPTKGSFDIVKNAVLGTIKDFLYRNATEQVMKDYMRHEDDARTRLNAWDIVLRNGRVGESYSQEIGLPEGLASDWGVSGLEGTGLRFDKVDGDASKGVISGVPSRPGDTTVTLWVRHKMWLEGARTVERKLPIAFNPDPRSLWRDIPTPQDVEYYKPDSDAAYVSVPAKDGEARKDIVAASRRGRSHAQEGKPRDDHFRVGYVAGSDWYVMAVADGAGSAVYSRKGSWIACDTVVDAVAAKLGTLDRFDADIGRFAAASEEDRKRLATSVRHAVYEVVADAALNAYKKIKAEADAKGRSMREYATTLMIAICKKFPSGWFIASYWVGDGAVAVYRVDREGRGVVKLLGEPDGGEYAGQTRFLTMPEMFKDYDTIANRLRLTVVDDFKALVLMTDGVSDAKFETDARLQDPKCWDAFWDDLSRGVDLRDDDAESKDRLLGWLDFWSPGNHDDRTIAVLY